MATVEHSTLTTGELHEPKGIATANTNTLYIADGAGSGSWRLFPHAECHYSSYPTGTTVSAPRGYTRLNVASVASTANSEFSHVPTRLTYTGARTIDFSATMLVTLEATSTSEAFFRITKNGQLVGAEHARGVNNNVKYFHMSCLAAGTMSTNDYFEIDVKCDAGDIKINGLSFHIVGNI